jgi:hypothetical protein
MSSPADQETIFSDDFTRLAQFQSRSWTFGDISLAAIGGVQWDAAIPALITGLKYAGPAAVVLLVCGINPLLAVLVAPIPAALTYRRRAKERTGGLSEGEKAALRKLDRKRPAEFLGLAGDNESTTVVWDVIVYAPRK